MARNGGVRVDRIITRGEFIIDGQTFTVDNNIWLVGDDNEVVVIDAAHDPSVILAAIEGRRVSMILATHGHNDHINAAVELSDQVRAPIALCQADLMLWEAVYPGRPPDLQLADGQQIPTARGGVLHVMHTPGHSPGGVCLYGVIDAGPVLFSGDTLFRGGPGATGRSFSDFPTILDSIRRRLLVLPPETIVHTGHGDDTTIGDEALDYSQWILRGH